MNYGTNTISEFNPETEELTPIFTIDFNSYRIHGLDRNPVDGKLYITKVPGDNVLEFHEVDLEAGEIRLAKSFNTTFSQYNYFSFGFLENGDIYLYQEVSGGSVGNLYYLDWSEGIFESRGSSNTPSILGGDFDENRGVYWAADESNGKVYQLNPTDGSVIWTSVSTWNAGSGPNIADVDVATDGSIWVAANDSGNSKILDLNPSDNTWTVRNTVPEQGMMYIATLPVVSQKTYSFSLVGSDNDNHLFVLDENGTLKTANVFDYETNASTYTITVQAKDEYNSTIEGNFTVSLLDLFEDLDGDGTADHLDEDMDGDLISNVLENHYGSDAADASSTPPGLLLDNWYLHREIGRGQISLNSTYGTAQLFYEPYSLNGSERIYVADNYDNKVRVFDVNGTELFSITDACKGSGCIGE